MKILSAAELLSANGRVTGPVFVHRRRTLSVRLPYPPKTPTTAQKRSRDAFRTADSAWSALSAGDKQAWRDYRSYQRNWGYNRFMRINIPRVLAGLPIIENPAMIP